MEKISTWIVKRRGLIVVLVMLLAAVCGALIPRVGINSDMTKYLPDDSSMKRGMEVMEQEFPGQTESYAIRVMFEGLSQEQKPAVQDRLAALDYVDEVAYQADSEAYNQGDYTLYSLRTSYGYDTPEEAAIEAEIARQFAGSKVVLENDDASFAGIPPVAVAVALAVVLAILLLACRSYLEPLLFLFTIGIAVVLNMGSNLLLGEVSDVTMGIAAILQMVLSMDYSLILMNRYRQELQKNGDKNAAMARALTAAFGSITSSSVTTMVGLLMLLFMSFKIGADLGIVLAKGVFCSLLCVFTVLPTLILLFHGAILKTEKRRKTQAQKQGRMPRALGGFSYRLRGGIVALLVVLFAASWILQGFTKVSYTVPDEDPVAAVFAPDNAVVVVYANQDEDAAASIARQMEAETSVKTAVSYGALMETPRSAAELAEVASAMGGGVDISPEMLRVIYYAYGHRDETPPISLDEFVRFLTEDVAEGENFGEYLDDSTVQSLDALHKFTDAGALAKPPPG